MTAVLLLVCGVLAGALALTGWLLVIVVARLKALEAARPAEPGRPVRLTVVPVDPGRVRAAEAQAAHLAPVLRAQVERHTATKPGGPDTTDTTGGTAA